MKLEPRRANGKNLAALQSKEMPSDTTGIYYNTKLTTNLLTVLANLVKFELQYTHLLLQTR